MATIVDPAVRAALVESGAPSDKGSGVRDQGGAYARRMGAAAKSRVSILETLSAVLPVLTRELGGAPDPAILPGPPRTEPNQNAHAPSPEGERTRAISGARR